MKTALLVLLLALPGLAQSRPDIRPDKPIVTSLYTETVPVGEAIADRSGTPHAILEGFVLKIAHEDGRPVWKAVPVNSCEWCGRPMTFRQAMFDKRSLSLWVTEFALTVADTEIVHAICPPRTSRCGEANPLLLGSTRRSVQYGIRLPVLTTIWVGMSVLRKGDKIRDIGGMRHWWVFPAIYQTESTVGIVSNLARRGSLSSQ